jgi:hypothetical protein
MIVEGSGFIGLHTADQLVDLGEQVVLTTHRRAASQPPGRRPWSPARPVGRDRIVTNADILAVVP